MFQTQISKCPTYPAQIPENAMIENLWKLIKQNLKFNDKLSFQFLVLRRWFVDDAFRANLIFNLRVARNEILKWKEDNKQ